MNRGRLRLAVAILAVSVALAHAADRDEPFPMPGSLEEVDQALAMLRNMIWALPDAMGGTAVDGKGGSLSKDLSAIVLTEDTSKAIADARAAAESAISANPQGDAGAALQPLAELVQGEVARIGLLLTSWTLPELRRVHMAYIDPLLARIAEDERASYLAKLPDIDTLALQVREMAGGPRPAEHIQSEQFRVSYAAIPETFNSVRQELSRRVAAQAGPTGFGPVRPRTSECPLPAEPRGADSGLSVRRAADVSAHYPPELQRFGVEGVVRVAIDVSAEGCITQVAITESSGVPEMDEAAQQVAFAMEMYPASRNGKAIGMSNILPVRFQLVDMPLPIPR